MFSYVSKNLLSCIHVSYLLKNHQKNFLRSIKFLFKKYHAPVNTLWRSNIPAIYFILQDICWLVDKSRDTFFNILKWWNHENRPGKRKHCPLSLKKISGIKICYRQVYFFCYDQTRIYLTLFFSCLLNIWNLS